MPDNTPRHDVAAQAGKAIAALLAPAPAPHVTRYLARVDDRLAELTNDVTRRGFLGDELAKWQFRYDAFVRKVDACQPTDPDVTAWDFADTIAALDKRLAKYPAVAA